jgi:LysM repeat protein
VERICPFLALGSDARTAVAGFDPEHRCWAARPPLPLERAEQLSLCLEPDHRACPRYAAALAGASGQQAWPRPASDAVVGRTRLILGPESSLRRLRPARSIAPAARRWALGGTLAVVGLTAVAGGVTGALGSLPVGPEPTAQPTARASMTAAGSQAAVAEAPSASVALPTPPASATPQAGPATPVPATSQPAPPSQVAPPPVRTYVVQPGDTLHGIALQFGTTIAALQRANDLADTDVIVIGQVLVIP